MDIKLEVGQISQSVDVTAAAGAAAGLQAAEVSLTSKRRRSPPLPLDGRNFIPLLTLAPGRRIARRRLSSGQDQWQPAPRTNEYIYDGISVLQPRAKDR